MLTLILSSVYLIRRHQLDVTMHDEYIFKVFFNALCITKFSNVVFFFTQRHFDHLSIIVLKITITVFASLCFQTSVKLTELA